MKKLVFTGIMSLMMITLVNAQYGIKKEKFAFNYGVKAGIGKILSRPEFTEIGNERNYVIHEVKLAGTTPQISVGGFARKRFGWLFAEGNVMYSTYGASYDVKSYINGDGSIETRNERFSYIDLQVTGGVIENGFRIAVGPVMHLLAGHSSEMTSLENYNQILRKMSYGFSGLIGYDYAGFSLELKYDKAFRTVGDHIYYGTKKSQFKETPDALMLQVSYFIK